jgi:hypothetical protein
MQIPKSELIIAASINLLAPLLLKAWIWFDPQSPFRGLVVLIFAVLMFIGNLWRVSRGQSLRKFYLGIAAANLLTYILMGSVSAILALDAYWNIVVYFVGR